MAATQPPLILCMANSTGEEVALHIEPNDDFQSFLDKAKSLLGFDVDINSVTKQQPVSLKDNIYQFLINAEQNPASDAVLATNNYKQMLEPNAIENDQVYILDDGTQIRASQIHFDNEDPQVDLTAEKIPFVKYTDDVFDEVDADSVVAESTILHNIVESPVSRWSDTETSPQRSFVNSLPFKLVCNNTAGFEAQFAKFLESSSAKTYATLNTVTNRNKSPRSLIRANFENYHDRYHNRNTDEFTYYTREDILNMFKDSPVASLPYDSQSFSEKRKHVRKTDPSRLVHKSWNTKPISYIDVDGVLIAESESQNCFICDKYVHNNIEKLYLFDNEDQRLHRTSPQKKKSTQLKIICLECLNDNFKPCRMKDSNQSLNSDEYLVIRNNQQYIFKKINALNFKSVRSGFSDLGDAKAIIDKIESKVLKDKEKDEFVKVEIGSDGEIITKPVDGQPKSSDDVIIVKDEMKGSSSDVEIIENEPEIDDNIIDNLDDADDEVIEFLGKYECDSNVEVQELKCRFCEQVFADVPEVIAHGDTHKHVLEDGEVFPCPLCNYGYANFKWLKGHLKAAHEKSSLVKIEEKSEDNRQTDDSKIDLCPTSSPPGSPIARRTRSAVKNTVTTDDQKETTEKPEDCNTATTSDSATFVIKTEVKQECLDSSDDEIWIVQTADEAADKELQHLLGAAKIENVKEEDEKYSCNNCGQWFDSLESFTAHKCLRNGRKRKCRKDGPVICVPTQEDFMKRARGRSRRVDDSIDNDLLVVRSRKKKPSEPTSDPQIVTCHNCNESFTSKVRLKFHMSFHESTAMLTADGQYACVECADTTFATETELFDHVHFQHHKQKRWQCPVKGCGKTFFLRATLTKHSRTHTDTRRYVCGDCGKRFLDKQTLDEHGVTHLQIKPFQCHICLKQLTRRSRLRMHLRAHEEELRPRLVLVCAVCSRAFRDSADVQDHVTRSPGCIEEFANELKEEDPGTGQLSPTSGLVRHSVEVDESSKLRKLMKREVHGPLAEALLAQVADEARAIVRVVEIEKAFRCEYCEDVFYSEEGLNTHRLIHKGVKNPFKCHICKVSFATYSRCTTHKTTHGFYKRSLADAKKQTGKSSDIKQEAGPSAIGILGYGDFPVVKHFLCEDCGRSYLHWTYLQVHRRMKHANENLLYKCNHCNLTLPNSWSVSYHRKKMHGATGQDNRNSTAKITKEKEDYRIPCRDCDEVLPNKTALYKHRKKDHSDSSLQRVNKPGVFWCGSCGKQYGSRAGLEAHARSHAARAAACAKCGHSFPTVSELHSHLKLVHGHELDFSCDMCCKTFCSRAELSVHARTHSLSKPHACPECAHSFRTLSMLNEHMRTHTGERPFPCDVCGVAFRRSTAMRNHRLIHTGVRNWACGRCPKRFRIRSELRTHLRLKHPAYLAVIEVQGLNPTPEEVMEHLNNNHITHDKVIEITKLSFAKGSSSIIPNSSRALAMLSGLPRTQVACGRTCAPRPYELCQPTRRGRGIAKNPRKPKILQHGGDDQHSDPNMYSVELGIRNEHESETTSQAEPDLYPVSINASGEELSDLNVQLLLRDGAMPNGNQMVQLQLDESMLLE